MLRDRVPARLNLQLHKYIWDPTRAVYSGVLVRQQGSRTRSSGGFSVESRGLICVAGHTWYHYFVDSLLRATASLPSFLGSNYPKTLKKTRSTSRTLETSDSMDDEHFGSCLRRAEDRALTIGDVSASTKVPRSAIEMLEVGRAVEIAGARFRSRLHPFVRQGRRHQRRQPLGLFDRAVNAKTEAALAEAASPVSIRARRRRPRRARDRIVVADWASRCS